MCKMMVFFTVKGGDEEYGVSSAMYGVVCIAASTRRLKGRWRISISVMMVFKGLKIKEGDLDIGNSDMWCGG